MKRRIASICALGLAASFAACDSTVDAPDTARLTIMLTDAPGDFSAAVVTISSIYLQGSADSDAEISRVMLLDEPITTDLLTLSDDVQTLVDGVVIGAGNYGQLRFVIDGAYIVVETDQGEKVYSTPDYAEAPEQVDGTLMCPSCAQSGIKVNLTGGLTLGDEDETVLVDFDVSQSFGHEAGASGKWIMHPTLKAAPIDAAASVDVSLSLGSGVVLPAIGAAVLSLADFSVELRSVDADPSAPGETVIFADADGDGTFNVSFDNVVPGDYTLNLKGPAGLTFTTDPVLPVAVTVQSGASVTASLVILTALPS